MQEALEHVHGAEHAEGDEGEHGEGAVDEEEVVHARVGGVEDLKIEKKVSSLLVEGKQRQTERRADREEGKQRGKQTERRANRFEGKQRGEKEEVVLTWKSIFSQNTSASLACARLRAQRRR